jgi:hypothetical protein
VSRTGHKIGLSENSQQVAHQHNQKNGAKPYTCATAGTPPAVSVVSSAPAEDQHQNNNQNDQHLTSPSLREFSGLFGVSYLATENAEQSNTSPLSEEQPVLAPGLFPFLLLKEGNNKTGYRADGAADALGRVDRFLTDQLDHQRVARVEIPLAISPGAC